MLMETREASLDSWLTFHPGRERRLGVARLHLVTVVAAADGA